MKTFKQYIEENRETDELVLYINNDKALYKKFIKPLMNSLRKEFKKGKKLDIKRAAKSLMSGIKEAVKKYQKEIAKPQDIKITFSKKDMEIATNLVNEIKLGN